MLASPPAIRERKTDVDIKNIMTMLTIRYNNGYINLMISFVVKFMFTFDALGAFTLLHRVMK